MNENTSIIVAFSLGILGFILTDLEPVFSVILKGLGIITMSISLYFIFKRYSLFKRKTEKEIEAKDLEMEINQNRN